MTPQQIEAMKQALEALEIAQESCIHGEMAEPSPIFSNAITALEEALAQPEQEPVIDKSAAIRIATSLGWTPHRNPLSAEKVSEICAEWTDENGNTGSFGRRQIARAIEAAHGIKENT